MKVPKVRVVISALALCLTAIVALHGQLISVSHHPPPDGASQTAPCLHLVVIFYPNAQAGSEDKAASAVGGQILEMVQELHTAIIKLPAPCSMAALKAAEAKLRSSPSIKSVEIESRNGTVDLKN